MLVFVSSCLQDAALVKPLILQLGVMGHSVQYEPKMPGGQIRWKQVMASIKDSDVFIVALTDRALRSESRRLEMQYARRLGKRALGVRLTELTVEIPPELNPILDYTVADKQSNLQLVMMLNKMSLIGLVPPAAAVPDWRIPLLKMQTPIKTPGLSAVEQATIVSNLQEFMERRETLRAARSLLKTFARRKDLDPAIQEEIEITSKQLKQSYSTQRRARLRNMAMGGMVVLMIFVVAGFLMFRKARNEAAAQTAQAEASQVLLATEEATLNVTEEIETVTPTMVPTQRPTLTETLVPPAVFTIEDLSAPTITATATVSTTITMTVSTLQSSGFASALTSAAPQPTSTAD
jgi:hypothetical protein